VDDNLIAAFRDQILRRIRAEYLEMPGLRLTRAQAGRLWGLDGPTCDAVLDRLTKDRFLQRCADGTYARLTDGALAFPSPRMAKVTAIAICGPNRAAPRR
jgi:hypothetical protein